MTSLPIMYFALFDFEHEKGDEDQEAQSDAHREGSQ